MQVSVKNSVEGVRRFQVVESEANAGLALGKRISGTGNQSVDPGRGAAMSQRTVTSPRPNTTGRGGHWGARAWAEAMEGSITFQNGAAVAPGDVRHLTEEGDVGAQGGRGEPWMWGVVGEARA